MKNSDYWKKRFEDLEQSTYSKSEKYYIELQKQYNKAIKKIEDDIFNWYLRVAENNEISYAQAKRLLKGKSLEGFKWTLEDYIKYGKENAINQEWMKELENASARAHITRLDALKIQMQQHVEELFKQYESGMSEYLTDAYSSRYYRTAYEIAKGTNVGTNFYTLSKNKIDTVLKSGWGLDEKNFSSRIWTNKEKLVNNLNNELVQNVIRGEAPDVMINNISNTMNVSKRQAANLVQTESAAISSMAQKDCFAKLDVEQYEIVATLDTKTSETCRSLDSKVFDMVDYKVGQTAPPFHCRCRTSTAPYFNDEFTQEDERAYRDIDGNTKYVKDMSYKEWEDKFVEQDSNKRSMPVDKKVFSNNKTSVLNKINNKQIDKDEFYNCYDYFNNKFQNGVMTPLTTVYNNSDAFYHIIDRHEYMMSEENVDRIVNTLNNPCSVFETSDKFGNKGNCYLENNGTNPLIVIDRNGIITAYEPDESYLKKIKMKGKLLWQSN